MNKIITIELGVQSYRLVETADPENVSDQVEYGEVVGLATETGYFLTNIPKADQPSLYLMTGETLSSGIIEITNYITEDVIFEDEEEGGDSGEEGGEEDGEDGETDPVDDGEAADDDADASTEADDTDSDDTDSESK